MLIDDEVLKETKELIIEIKTEVSLMIEIMKDLVDPDDCDLDHHGNCQAHGWTVGEGDNKECPQKRLKEFLIKQKVEFVR
jgi:hypothetical protein